MQLLPYQFENFEIEHSLFDIEIDNVPIWERLRFGVFRDIQREHGAGQAHTGIKRNRLDYLRGAFLFLTNFHYRNPFLADEHEVLFVGHPRRKKNGDGTWWDIYSDPIHEGCDHDYLHLETPHQLTHHRPARTANLRYLDVVIFTGTIQRLLGIREPVLSDGERYALETVESAIESEFDASVDVVDSAVYQLYVRNTQLWLYRRLLKRINPELLVLVVSYGKETLIEACRELDIPVVELQHGVIYEHHFGYSYPGIRTKRMFPDYLLTFGEFWKDAVEYPIPDERVIPVGYPHLENSIEQYEDIDTRDQILFISQGTIGEQLSKFALEVAQHGGLDANIVYKLHPGEYDRWEDEYPWLIDADFEIVDNSESQLYELFAESSAQVGVASTAVYEGLAFGLETFVFDAPGSRVLQPLVEEGAAVKISTVDELETSLGSGSGSFDREHYFRSSPTERMCETIDDLVETGSVYSPRQ